MNIIIYSFKLESEEIMMKQGEMLLSGRTILGLCLVVIGFLTLGYGGVEFGLSVFFDWWSPLYLTWITCDARCSSICQAGGLGLDGDQYLALYSQYA